MMVFHGKMTTFVAVFTHAARPMGGIATYWEASLMLCFWPFERRKLKLVIKDKCGGECYGCSIYSPECVARANYMPSRTLFGAYYILYRRGCSDFARSITSGFLRPKRGTGRRGYPAFCMPFTMKRINTLPALGYKQETNVNSRYLWQILILLTMPRGMDK